MKNICEALKSMISKYFCTTQELRGTFWKSGAYKSKYTL